MNRKQLMLSVLFVGLLLVVAACDEGIDDWNSSARIQGNVYTDPSHTQGVPGVRIVIESDPDATAPYEGPDRWTVTDNRGHFAGYVFLGSKAGSYNYVADLSVGYFWRDKAFRWSGGITVAPGTDYTLPAVDTTMFFTIGGQ